MARRDEAELSDDREPEAVSGDHEPARGPRRRRQLDVLVAIGAGGALGALARYGVAQLVTVRSGGFPWATFWTNVSGSLVLGFALVVMLERLAPSRLVRPFFAVGFLGAYTTFSTYIVETDTLVKDGHGGVAAAYVVGSVIAGFLAVWIGIVLARLVPLGLRTRSTHRRH